MNKNDLRDYYGNNRYYQTYDAVPMNDVPYSPIAGLVANAFANYRLSHPLVRWYYKIKQLLRWRINIKLYKDIKVDDILFYNLSKKYYWFRKGD